MDAIKNFKERCIPVFASLEDHQRRLSDLEKKSEQQRRSDQRIIESQSVRILELEKAQRNDVPTLKGELAHQRRINEDAIASAEAATKEVVRLREEVKRMQDERALLNQNMENERDKDKDLTRYKGYCDDYKKRVSDGRVFVS